VASNAVAVGLELADATPVNNHRAKVGTPGIDDLETLDDFTRLIGAGELRCSTSTQSGERGHRSQTEGDTYRELAPAHLLRQIDPSSALLVPGSVSPTTIAAALVPEEQGADAPEWPGDAVSAERPAG
jgi:hypothetical protein